MTPPNTSYRIGQKAAQTFYYAAEQAERIGLPLNAHATINFALSACEPWEAPRAFARLRENFYQKWASRDLPKGQRHTPAWAFAFQNVRDKQPFLTMNPGDPHNVHVHWALHVPPALRHEFEGLLWEWVGTVTGGSLSANTIKVTYPAEPDDSVRLMQYLGGGTDEKFSGMYRFSDEPKGIIVGGRRTGTSHSIGPTARRDADRREGIDRRLNMARHRDRQNASFHASPSP